jgi:hypothetical protein
VDEDQLKLYRALSRAPFPRSYVGKKVFITAFLGTHVPLVALLVYFVRHQRFAIGGVLPAPPLSLTSSYSEGLRCPSEEWLRLVL